MSEVNDKPKFAVDVLQQYSHETGSLPRSTSDLSPMEEWLILQLYAYDKLFTEEHIKSYTQEAFNAGKQYGESAAEQTRRARHKNTKPDFETWYTTFNQQD